MIPLPERLKMKMRLLLSLLVSLSTLAEASALELVVRPGAEDNLVVFRSEAPMESFEGKTREVRGEMSVDLGALEGPFRARFEVDLASLETGSGMRDKHMRENHLETDEFPSAVFRAREIRETSKPALEVGDTVTFLAKGEFDLHGVTRKIEVPIEATREDEGQVRIKAQFGVRLSDHRIERPKFLFMKLGEEQQVTIDVRAGVK